MNGAYLEYSVFPAAPPAQTPGGFGKQPVFNGRNVRCDAAAGHTILSLLVLRNRVHFAGTKSLAKLPRL